MSAQRSSPPVREGGPQEPGPKARFSPLALVGGLLGPMRRQPIHAALIAVTALLATVGIGVGAWIVGRLRSGEPDLPTVEMGLSELDDGRHEPAREIARKLQAGGKLEFEEQGGPLYILGVAAYHEAEQTLDSDQRPPLYAVAAKYLDEAREHGFPEGRETHGLYLLAQGEYQAGHYERSLPLLLEARRANAKHRTELTGLAVTACLRCAAPKLAEALKYNQQYLTDAKLKTAERHAAILEGSRIQFLLGDYEACAKTLAELPAEAGGTGRIVMQARLLIQQGDAAQAARDPADTTLPAAAAAYQEAANLLQPVQKRAGSADQAVREAQLLFGVCLLKMGQLPAAEKQFLRTRRLNSTAVEGLAAALEEADLQRQDGRPELAATRYVQVLQDVGQLAEYRNPWLPLDQLRARIEIAMEGFREQGQFSSAAEVMESLPPVFSAVRSTELKAELQQAWGKSLAKEAERASAAESAKLLSESRVKYREAGLTFAKLAELRKIERQYPEDVWRSAQNLTAGQDYHQALRMIKQFLAEESRKRRSEALIALGQCYLALNKVDQAVPPLLECVENFRKHPDCYRARLVASQAYLEKNQLAEAKNMLIDNLENESLAPSSLEWRDSLFALGRLLHREATDLETQSRKQGVDSPYPDIVKVALKDLERSFNAYQEAIDRLSEAAERYPDAPQALESRYLLADSHRQSAKWPRKLRGSLAIETTRATLLRQAQDELKAAAGEYETLLTMLNERQEKSGLTALELIMLRNCYFARADVLFDLGRFEDAIAAYSSATNRYHDRPEALEAFVQIASCYRRLNRPAEARGTLEQAKVVLRRIPADAAFMQTTRYDRGEWTQLLNWLSSL